MAAIVRIFAIPALLLLASGICCAAPQEPVVRSRSADVNGPPDLTKEFDIKQSSPFRRAPGIFQSKNAASKEFYYQQKFAPKGYRTRDFATKSAWMSGMTYATKQAGTTGKYEIPNAGKAAAVKTARTKDAREAQKTAATKSLHDGNREYRGPEADKLHKALDQDRLPRINNELKELKTIDDVRELLNKNK